jgi:hypothetical protein
MVQSQSGQIVQDTLSQKSPTQNRASGLDQVVKCLPSKHEAWSSNSSTAKKKKWDFKSYSVYPFVKCDNCTKDNKAEVIRFVTLILFVSIMESHYAIFTFKN